MTGDDSKYRIQYPYVTDENGVLTYIEDVDRELRHDHSFVCPNCGRPMLPRLGEHNAHCFAHDKGGACGKESYIHKAAKRILARRFNENDSFPVSFTTICLCDQAGTCNHFNQVRCAYRKRREYDLKQHYDLPAEVEKTVVINGTEFRPDVVLLSSDRRRDPIFLEVFFMHESTEKKRSNCRCIEFRVKDFSDLRGLECGPIVESETIEFLNFKPIGVTQERIVDYHRDWSGVLDSVLPYCMQSRESRIRESGVMRFILYENGEYRQTRILEEDRDKHEPHAVADMTFRSGLLNKVFSPLYILAKTDRKLLTCHLCENCRYLEGKAVGCKKESTSSAENEPDLMRGACCDSYRLASWITQVPGYDTMLEDNIEGQDYVIWIAPDKSSE